ncbi:MAG: quinate 5-dehydrogenase [Armatimonadota bacterium]|nr:quinate 5-dehydrogenase [Armatimonadota bacterium]
MKRVLSVSLGSSKRNKSEEVEILGETFSIGRVGVDGDLKTFSKLFRDLDGKVDALGVGGADLYLWIRDRRYTFRQIRDLVSGAKSTPVVDGSGLKNTLESKLIHTLQDSGEVDFSNLSCLLMSAVDRFGMALALSEVARNVVYGDLMFGIGLPIPLKSYRAVERLGRIALPVITQLPFKWFYPTGEKQEQRTPKYESAFVEADVVCGDWHFIRRYAPERLDGKIVITNTLRKADIEMLRDSGVSRAYTSTPNIGGESFGTNVMEGVLVAMLGRRPEELTPSDYEDALSRLGWKPNAIALR